MRANRCFRKSKKVQRKRIKRKTKRTKKSKTTRTRGGFHIIEPEVDAEIDMDIDENILPGLRDIMDDMISLPINQKRDIFAVNRIVIDFQIIYTEIRPDEVIDPPHQTFQHEKTDILLNTLSLNIENMVHLIATMLEHNDIDAAETVHYNIMSRLKPCTLIGMADLEDFENTFDYLDDLIDEQSPYQRQFKNDFEILLDNQNEFIGLLLPFIETRAKRLGQFCRGGNYNEDDYIMPEWRWRFH